MFGIKKKKSDDSTTVMPQEASQFQVHTMEDDIKQINGLDGQANQPLAVPTPSPNKGLSESPFFSEKPNEGSSVQKVAVTQTEAASDNLVAKDNPFFSKSTKDEQDKSANQFSATDNSADNAHDKKVNESVNLPTPKDVPEVSVPTAPLTSESPKDTPLDKDKISQEIKLDAQTAKRSPVNDIEAEIASFTNKETTRLDNSGEEITTFSPLTQTPSEMFQEMGGEDKNEKKPKKKNTRSLKKILKILITLFILAALGIGGYFGYTYLKDQGALSLQENPINDLIEQEPEQEQTQPSPADDEMPMKKFALEFPNYIELTDEQDSSEQFRQKLSEIALSLPEQNTAAPISFLITDPNGTPLTLRSFASITKMSLPPAVLDQAGDAFEIYAYEEAGQVRFGIGFDYILRQAMSDALSDNESQLPDAFIPLYNTSQTIQGENFADNVYGNYAVRFANLLPDESVSIDYTVADKVYIGTSKNSQRAILDKYATDDYQE